MYDTINFWLGIEQAGIKNLSAFAENHLTDISEIVRPDGQVFLTGHLLNYKVSISLAGLSFKGSLAKYFLADNLHTLTRQDSQRAIEKLADEAHLPVHLAKVTQIDLAHNMLMNYEPKAYYKYLLDCSQYKRHEQPKSIYYTNGQRVKLFYDKLAEAKAKGVNQPDVLTGQNCLRYELRFVSRLPKQLNRPDVPVSLLPDERFYIGMVARWHDEYKAINKKREININFEDMKSPKDFFRQLQLFAVHEIGQDKLMQAIDEMRSRQTFEKPEYYSRLKKELRELCSTPDLTTSSELITELDKKVNQAGKHFR